MKSFIVYRANQLLYPLFLCFALLGLSLEASAQMFDKPYVYRNYKAIDTAYLKCEYRYAFVDSGKTDTHLMVLLVGNKAQKFEGDDDYQRDSLGIIFDNKPYEESYFRTRERGCLSIDLILSGRSI